MMRMPPKTKFGRQQHRCRSRRLWLPISVTTELLPPQWKNPATLTRQRMTKIAIAAKLTASSRFRIQSSVRLTSILLMRTQGSLVPSLMRICWPSSSTAFARSVSFSLSSSGRSRATIPASSSSWVSVAFAPRRTLGCRRFRQSSGTSKIQTFYGTLFWRTCTVQNSILSKKLPPMVSCSRTSDARRKNSPSASDVLALRFPTHCVFYACLLWCSVVWPPALFRPATLELFWVCAIQNIWKCWLSALLPKDFPSGLPRRQLCC